MKNSSSALNLGSAFMYYCGKLEVFTTALLKLHLNSSSMRNV